MDPSFYQRLKRMRWSVFESLNCWPMNGSQFHQPTCCLGMRKLLPVAAWCESWGRLAPPLSQDGFYTARPPLFLWPASPLPWVSLARRNSQRKPDAVALNLLCGICINSLHNAVQPPHLAFVIFEPLPSSLFLSVPQVNQEILFVFLFLRSSKMNSVVLVLVCSAKFLFLKNLVTSWIYS